MPIVGLLCEPFLHKIQEGYGLCIWMMLWCISSNTHGNYCEMARRSVLFVCKSHRTLYYNTHALRRLIT